MIRERAGWQLWVLLAAGLLVAAGAVVLEMEGRSTASYVEKGDKLEPAKGGGGQVADAKRAGISYARGGVTRRGRRLSHKSG